MLYGDYSRDRLGASYLRAFEQLGHRVVSVDTREITRFLPGWLQNRLGHRLTIRSLSLRRKGASAWNRHFTQTVQDVLPQMILILNGDFLMPETLAHLSASGVRTMMFHADNPLPPSSNNRPETIPLALACDIFMIWSRKVQQQLKDLGVRRVEYLPFAWDPEVFPHIGLLTNPSHKVVFIGGWDRDREEWLTPIARQFDLKIWGPGYWATRTRPGSILRHCWQGQALSGPNAARTLCDSEISLNILRRQNLPDGTNMRTFEIPGCGALAVSTRTQGALEIFPESEAGWYFSTPEECIAVIAQLAGTEDLRRRAAQKAHDIVRQGHRYVDRARQIVEFYHSL